MTWVPVLDLDHTPQLPAEPAPDADSVLAFLQEHGIGLLRLQFCDIAGTARVVEVPARRFAAALAGEVTTDGSAVEGAPGTEEMVLRLHPDLASVAVLPWREGSRRGAHLWCDLRRADGSAFEGDPRGALRRACAELDEEGYQVRVSVEVEFFLLDAGTGAEEDATGGYYQLLPAGPGEVVRRDAVSALEAVGFPVESAHHEAAPGQHEIALGPCHPVRAADGVLMLKHLVRSLAAGRGMRAVFMPKPHGRRNGSGLHTHLSLYREGQNAFHDPERPEGLSDLLRFFVAGLLRHARGYCAITNPLVNSYKRLHGGHEAPANVAWSLYNRSLLVRVPPERGERTRCEHRLADPSANPYLALAVQLAAGLDGIRQERLPGDPISKNLTMLTPRERQRLRIETVPGDLGEALEELERSRTMRGALGEYLYSHFVERKRAEWEEYSTEVHDWELRRYLEA